MEQYKAAAAVLGIMIPLLLGVGTLLRASIDRLDDRVDRTGEYVVTVNTDQWKAINDNVKSVALLRQELRLLERYVLPSQPPQPQPHQAGEDSYD